MHELGGERASGLLRLRRLAEVECFGFRRGLIVGSPREPVAEIEARLERIAETIDDWDGQFEPADRAYPPGFLPTIDPAAWSRRRIAASLCAEAIEGLVLRWSNARIDQKPFAEWCDGADPAQAVLRLFPLVTLGLCRIEVPPPDHEALRKAYRARARLLHPDVHPQRDVRLQSERLAALGRAFRELVPPLAG